MRQGVGCSVLQLTVSPKLVLALVQVWLLAEIFGCLMDPSARALDGLERDLQKDFCFQNMLMQCLATMRHAYAVLASPIEQENVQSSGLQLLNPPNYQPSLELTHGEHVCAAPDVLTPCAAGCRHHTSLQVECHPDPADPDLQGAPASPWCCAAHALPRKRASAVRGRCPGSFVLVHCDVKCWPPRSFCRV